MFGAFYLEPYIIKRNMTIVTKLEKLPGLGGIWKFKCNFCRESRQGSYSRVRAHFLGIKGNLLISICKDHVLGFLFARKQQRLTS
ncbi:hypothetical protein OSB04_028641 [Centaurea solstitialis]|uniref:Uncharacterized protein n=1 Tax=Centaurea solstitialis TaxID=347529 RepID=A0AA38W7X5_9ASTR|nr:hypothetical protein OSB04_028641 [Centaurea solstitialis]